MNEEVFRKIWDYSDEKYGSYGLLEKNARWPRFALGIEHVPECKNNKERGDESQISILF